MAISKSINILPKRPPRVGECCPEIRPNPVGEQEGSIQARIFAALGDPTRLRILSLLAAQTEALCVCEIAAAFTQNQPTISHHLKLLRVAGLVNWEKKGLWVYYSPNVERMAQTAEFLSGMRERSPERASAPECSPD